MLNFNLFCFQLVRCNGQELLKYKDNLLEIIKITLHLKCVEGYELIGQLIRYTLRALTLHYPLDYRSTAESFDRPVTEYLPIHVSRTIIAILYIYIYLSATLRMENKGHFIL